MRKSALALTILAVSLFAFSPVSAQFSGFSGFSGQTMWYPSGDTLRTVQDFLSLTIPGLNDSGSTKCLQVDSSGVIDAASEECGTPNALTSATYPLEVSGSNLSLAFGTTTNNVWSGTNDFQALTATTLDTGQGANELYDMDQNVLTSSSPFFNQLSTGSGSLQAVNVAGGTAGTLAAQVLGTTYESAGLLNLRFTNGSAGPSQILAHSRGTTIGSNVALQLDDIIGSIGFDGADGTNYVEGARIRALVDGTPGTNDMPGRLELLTTADGSSVSSIRMTIKNSGNVGIGTSDPLALLSLGSAVTTDKFLVYDAGNSSKYGFGIASNQMRIYSATNGRLAFGDYNGTTFTEYFTLDGSTNRVGVGTANPVSNLDVSSATGGTLTLSRSDTAIGSTASIGKIQFWGNDTQLTTQKIFAEIEAVANSNIGTDAAKGDLVFRTTGSTVGGSPVERMRIQYDGNVGIGVAPSADSRLNIDGNLQISAGSRVAGTAFTGNLFTVFRAFSQSGTNSLRLGGGTGATEPASDIRFYTGSAGALGAGTERFHINSLGNVGIGTSSPSSLLQLFSTGTTTLSIDSNSASQGSCIEMKDRSGVGYSYITVEDGVLSASTVSCK